jgi:hypothetical protein
MTPERLAALREHYDSPDTVEELAEGRWEAEVDSDPMVTTSLRLPKSLLDRVREEAVAEEPVSADVRTAMRVGRRGTVATA